MYVLLHHLFEKTNTANKRFIHIFLTSHFQRSIFSLHLGMPRQNHATVYPFDRGQQSAEAFGKHEKQGRTFIRRRVIG
jgi:hypothetical protein